jgi:GLPGLI family protein
MKNLLLMMIAIIPGFFFAQNNEGKITYKEEVKFDFELPEGMEHMRDKLPSSETFNRELLFNESTTLWKNAEGEQNEAESTFEDTNEEGNIQFKMVMVGSESQLFKDLDKEAKVEKTDFMGKVFLITGTLEEFPWKLTGTQKTIAGYECQQAVFQDTTKKIEAWFTPKIPISSGPAEFGALPGMILEINMDDGKTIISATKVELKKLEKDDIRPPKKGKKVSQEEFDEIVASKTEEMEQDMGGENVMRINIGGN